LSLTLPSLHLLPFFCYAEFLSFFENKFLLGYIHYRGGFVVTTPIRLTLYIIYIFSPSTTFPAHLKQLQEVS
jgi:hypothetical protein